MDVGRRTLPKKPWPAGFPRRSVVVEVKTHERKRGLFDVLPDRLLRRERWARLQKLHRAAGLLLQGRSGLLCMLVRAFAMTAVLVGMLSGFVAIAGANEQTPHRLTHVQDEAGRARSDERNRQNQRQQWPSHDSTQSNIAPSDPTPSVTGTEKAGQLPVNSLHDLGERHGVAAQGPGFG